MPANDWQLSQGTVDFREEERRHRNRGPETLRTEPTPRCEFATTTPKGAMLQAAKRGSSTRYKRCRNPARHTITIGAATLRNPDATREVRCCGLHKRLHETRGWLP